jgi:membrane-bound lytic murein transglycosylase D
MRFSFAGVDIDLSNDRVRSKLQGIFNIELRRAHQFIPRSGTYFPVFAPIIESHGIHPDIKYMAIVESNLSAMAHSPVGASGLWQFMPATARSMNLTINSHLDERRNVFRATDAACRYLLQNHRQLANLGVDCWLVTLATYNAGLGNMTRTIREQQGRDFFSLIMRVDETNNFVWRMIATKLIFEYEDVIFERPFERMPPLMETTRLERVVTNGHHDLSEWAIAQGTNIRELWELNPWISISRTRAGRFSQINHLIIPPGTWDVLVPIEAERDGARIASAETRFLQRNAAPAATGARHTVRRGETLGGIARRYNVSVDNLRRWNNISGDFIREGQVLVVAAQAAQGTTAQGSSNQGVTASTIRHTIQSGETLGGIARRYSVTVEDLRRLNNLRGDTIIAGNVLLVNSRNTTASAPAATTASGASPATTTASGASPATTTAQVPSYVSQGGRYTVREGDTLVDIASRLNVSLAHLLALNNLQTENRNGVDIVVIRPGQVLEY